MKLKDVLTHCKKIGSWRYGKILCLVCALGLVFMFFDQSADSTSKVAQKFSAHAQRTLPGLQHNLRWLAARQSSQQPKHQASVLQMIHQPTAAKKPTAPVRRTALSSNMTLLPAQIGGVNQAAHSAVQHLAHPRWTLVAGEYLHASLESAISTDLPGEVRAVLSQPAYAYVGGRVVLPVGSRLIGLYDHHASPQQTRVWVSWQRVITPGGVSIHINSPIVGLQGRSGVAADQVDRHFWQRFKQATLLSVIGGAVALTGDSHADEHSAAAAYRQALSDRFQNVTEQSLPSDTFHGPTLSLNPGKQILIFVRHDIDFFDVS